jgi:hypothetical protein
MKTDLRWIFEQLSQTGLLFGVRINSHDDDE